MSKQCVSIGIMLFFMFLPGHTSGQGCGPDTDCYTKCYEEPAPDKQVECFTKHIDAWPDCAGAKNLSIAYSARGFAYYMLNRYDKAIADYNKAIEVNSESVYPYFYRGNVYSALAQYNSAIDDYNKVIKLGLPEESDVNINSPAYCARGTAYANLKEYDKAVADLDMAIDLEPSGKCGNGVRGYAYFILGGVHYSTRQYAKAITDYNNAIELRPEYAEAYINRGNTYIAFSKYNAAIMDLNKAVELSSNVAVAYTIRGAAYYYLGDYDRAMEDFTKAIELDSTTPYAYYSCGVIHSIHGRKSEAEAAYSRAEAIFSAQISSPTADPGLYSSRGGLYLWTDKCAAARSDLEKAITLDKTDPYAYGNLGVYWWHCGHDKKKALKWYKKSFAHGFTQWDVLYNRAADGYFLAGFNEDPDFKALVEKYRAANMPNLPPTGEPSKSLAQTSLSNILDSLDAMAVLLKHPAVDGDISGWVAEMRANIAQDPKQVMELVGPFSGNMGTFIDNEYFNIFNLRPVSNEPAARAKEWETASKAYYAWRIKFIREAIRVIKGLKVLGAESPGLDFSLDMESRGSRSPYTPLGKVGIEALEHNLAYEINKSTGMGAKGNN